MKARALALASLLLFLPVCGFAQQETQGPGRRMLLHVEEGSGAGFSRNELIMISRSLMMSLQEQEAGIVVVSSPDGELRAADEKLGVLARTARADCWLSVALSGNDSATMFHARSFDLVSGNLVFDRTVRRDGRLSVLDLPFEKWTDIISLVRERYSVPTGGSATAAALLASAEATSAVEPPELTVHALPWTKVTVARGLSATTGSDGTVRIPIPSPGDFLVRAVLSDYYPSRQEVFITSSRSIQLVQEKASRWAVDGSLLGLQYPGVDLARFIIPNWVFVKLGCTTYLLGLALTGDAVFSNLPLTNIVVQAGAYFRPEDVGLRFYGTVGGFLRVLTPSGMGPLIDPLAPGGAQLSLGTEISGTSRGAFFFEWVPMLYFTTVTGLFQASFGNNDTFGWAFTSWGALSVFSFRIGYRWLL